MDQRRPGGRIVALAAPGNRSTVRNRGETFGWLKFAWTQGALHIWLTLAAPWRADNFTAAARQSGIAISPLAPFAVTADDAEQTVRITLSQPLRRATLTRALSRLRYILECYPNRPRAII